MRQHLVVLGALALVAGCSGSDEPSARPSPTRAAFHVEGRYETAVSLTASSCPGTTVAPNPTTVTHAAGATVLTVEHAGQTYSGTVTAAGAFRAGPQPVTVRGSVHTLSIVGGFTATGFRATVTAVVTPQNCRYVARWVGTKDGALNVLG